MDYLPLTGVSTLDLYIEASKSLNLKYKIISKEKNLIRFFNEKSELFFYNESSSVNDTVHIRISSNKNWSKSIFKIKGITTPESLSINNQNPQDLKNAMKFLKTHKKIVSKPVKGSSGKGIVLDIINKENLIKALQESSKFYDEVLLEKQVEGTNYRVLCFQGRIIHILERIPAFIIGDGISTVQELVNKKNSQRNKSKLPLLEIDANLIMDVNRIIPSSKIVFVQRLCNFSKGGETKAVDMNQIPKGNIKRIFNIYKDFGLNYCGVDIITKDIFDENSVIYTNEINSSPGILIHCISDMEFSLDIPTEILRTYFQLS